MTFCGDEYALDAIGVTCHDPQVVGASVVGDLTALRMLSLSDTGISELPPLRHVAAISTLDLAGTRIKSLSTLKPEEWKSLKLLVLNNTQLVDLSFVAGLPALEALEIRNTPVVDLSPALRNGSVQRIDASGTSINQLPSLAAARSLQDLNLGHTLVADLAGVRGAPALKTLWIDATLVQDLAPIGDAPQLADVKAGDTLASSASVDELRKTRPNLEIVHQEWHGTPEELRARILEWPRLMRASTIR